MQQRDGCDRRSMRPATMVYASLPRIEGAYGKITLPLHQATSYLTLHCHKGAKSAFADSMRTCAMRFHAVQTAQYGIFVHTLIAERVRYYLKEEHPGGATLEGLEDQIWYEEFGWHVQIRPDFEPKKCRSIMRRWVM